MECTVSGCERTARSVRSGLCTTHYARLRRSGQVELKSAEDRFWANVDKGDLSTDCWLWKGQLDALGYGRIWVKSRTLYVHRFAYELIVGLIPDGLTIDHRCSVRHCVNPLHLAPETLQENVRLAQSANAAKVTCPKGHRLDYVNTNGSRECTICRRDRINRDARRRKTLRRLDMPTGIFTVEDLVAYVVDTYRPEVEDRLRQLA
jgi:hypothetical protein